MRLLVVNYMYAPAINPRAIRWTAIAEHWARAGHAVDVVCAWFPGLPREEERNGVRLHRIGGGRAGLARQGAGASTEGAAPLARPSAARRAAQRTWRTLYWPDAYCPWLLPAITQTRRLLSRLRPDGLVTVSLPFTDHLVGLAAIGGSEGLPWLADTGDPFSFMTETPPNNQALYAGMNHSFERRVMRRADAVAVTTEGTLARYREVFPEAARKLHVIPPLVSIEADGKATGAFFPKDDRVRLVYVGTLYRQIRSPEFLLRLFDRLLATPLGARIELHVLGNVHDCGEFFRAARCWREGRVRLHGVVARGAALRAMQEATVLVNIGNDTPYQLPSKVVEYALARRPVLNLLRREDDSSQEFFLPHPACHGLLEREGGPSEEEATRLASFIAGWEGKPVEVPEDWLSRFGTGRIAEAYEGLLQSAKGRRP